MNYTASFPDSSQPHFALVSHMWDINHNALAEGMDKHTPLASAAGHLTFLPQGAHGSKWASSVQQIRPILIHLLALTPPEGFSHPQPSC